MTTNIVQSSSARVRKAPGRRRIALRLLSPAGLFYAVFLVIPMIGLLVLSLWSVQGFTIVPGFSFDNYIQIATSSLHRDVLIRTIGVGLSSAFIVVPLAFLLAYLLRFVFERRAQLITQLVLVTLFAGYLVRIYSWRTILGKEGILNSFLIWAHVIKEPLDALIYSPWAVAITLSGLILPLAVLPLSSAMANVSRDHLEVARDLGSRGFHLLRTVLVPMVMPGLSTAFAFSFLLAVGDFVTPSLVGGAQGVMIGNVIADQFRGIGSNWPLGAALVWVAIALVGLFYFVFMRLIRWLTRC